jgi:predicted lipid-binding transport protein (Tim44 family)
MQAAWDACDTATLQGMTTPQMFSELREQLPLRDALPNRTEVLSVQARLLAFDDFGSDWLATVEFSGMIREQPDRGAEPFRELWLLTCAQGRTGEAPPWRLARQQALL